MARRESRHSGRTNPLDVLGLASDAGAAEIRAARRRLAKDLHPDRGGDGRRMQELNAATAEALAGASEPTSQQRRPPVPDPSKAPPAAAEGPLRRSGRIVVEDQPSFVVEAPPAVAFAVLQRAAPMLGRIVDEDPSDVLDVVMQPPFACWCRLELLPDGAATSVGIVLVGADSREPPEIETVRDAWIAVINEGSSPT